MIAFFVLRQIAVLAEIYKRGGIVSLLQNMQKEIEAEGEKEEKAFDKFMCYCQQGSGFYVFSPCCLAMFSTHAPGHEVARVRTCSSDIQLRSCFCLKKDRVLRLL